MHRRVLWLLVVPFTLLSCAPTEPNVLRICATENTGFFEQNNGQLSGFEYDVLQSFADSQSLVLDVKWVTSDPMVTIIEMVAEGRCDIGAANFTPTAKRKQLVDFTVSYFPVRILALGSPQGSVMSYEELTDKRIAAPRYTSLEEIADSVPGAQKVVVGAPEELAEAVLSGKADVLILDSTLVPPLIESYPDLQPLFFLPTQGDIAFAIPKKWALRQALNQHIEGLRRGGQYTKFLRRNFEPEIVELLEIGSAD
ncbi:MAG: amino acid ABC transporter substrate-binding protein [bacterium]|nr:amino acid ABC transporter substrate-binding protein [bacterium]